MRLFIDVDNTILEHYNFYSKDTENRTHQAIGNNVEINRSAIEYMYSTSITVSPDSLRSLWQEEKVYILTKYPNDEFDYYKQKKLAQVLDISHEELLSKTDSEGNKKYLNVLTTVSKVDYVKDKFNVESIENFILIDDYSGNILEWEEAGGLGIKFYNEYNSPTHPSIGLSISDFKIIELLFKNHKFHNVFIEYTKSLLLEQVLSDIISEGDHNNIINVDREIYKSSLEVLGLQDNGNIFDYLSFAKEYYNMIDKIKPDYWHDFWLKHIKKEKRTIFKSSFHVDVKKLYEQTNNKKDYITIGVLTGKKNVSPCNVYITVRENANYLKGQKQIKRIKSLFEEIM